MPERIGLFIGGRERSMKQQYEIERKWLPGERPEGLSELPHREIRQGYLCREPVIRIRRDGEAYWLTYKGKGLMVREEYNLPLTKEAYESLLPKCEGRIIRKTRYQKALPEGYTAEIDVFSGDLEGLILLEVEFPDKQQAEAFRAPGWFGREVTEDRAYSNAALSLGTGQKPSGRPV